MGAPFDFPVNTHGLSFDFCYFLVGYSNALLIDS